ncbi:energy-coupling factor ABC transporter ATP-binding protein, partial [Eisenbergiella porci]|uniref:energy-coupling factor ABC transporter ATP-binding protein n=1 Tax=Eisenbergiella porci TaxID=2652274 RepID=UPI002A81A8F6
MENEVLLQVKGLSFTYGEEPVLKDVNLIIRRGEKIAVMGPNGAGKSTFFLNLNGVLKPDSGEILLGGSKIGKKELNLLHKKVGFVFQDADSQIIAANVRAEISFGPMNLGLKRSEVIHRVDAAVSYLGLEELQQRAPHYLSGGEKKQVSIADILAMEPELLIFDEPMAALDPMNAQRVEDILNKLHEDGKTLLIATHDVDFAWRFADRILVFCDGMLIGDGTPAEIFAQKEMMERAHLKKPSIMEVWDA